MPALAAMKEQRFPFVPKSTSSLRRGQFWSIPLAGGGFGAGCVGIYGDRFQLEERAYFGL